MIALLVHADASVLQSYRDALGCPVYRVQSHGSQFSGGYDERSGIAAQCPTVDAAVARYAPDALPGCKVVLIGFSAGCWAVRAWLGQPQCRERIAGVLLLDGWHASRGDDSLAFVDAPRDAAVVDYARSGGLLVVSHSQIVPPTYPSTRATARALLTAIGQPRGNDRETIQVGRTYVVADVGGDAAAHTRQLREIGPKLCRELLAPDLDAGGAPTERDPAPGGSLGERALRIGLDELARNPRPSSERRRQYLAGCLRESGGELRLLGLRDGNWCAASACWCTDAARQDGETVPHLYRASGLELERDAQRSGAWIPRADVAAGRTRPAVGDLAILQRGAPGAWTRHVARVASVRDTSAEYLDGNGAGSQWRMVARRWDDPAIRGWIHYPAAPAAPVWQPEADPVVERSYRAALLELDPDWDAILEERRRTILEDQ